MRIAVCDDEKQVRDSLCEIIKKEYPKAKTFVYCCGEELLAKKMQDDILFLDIQMPGINGMDVAKEIRIKNKDMIIIFITGIEGYVFGAFDVEAFHYLVKPFSESQFRKVLKNAVEKYQCIGLENKDIRNVLIKTKGEHIKINTKDIIFAEVFNRKIIIHKTDEDIEYYGRMSELEKMVGSGFFRCHRSYLVNMNFVVKYNASMIYTEKGNVLMAKQHYPEFVKAYLKYNMRKENMQ